MGRASIPVDLFNPGQVFACLGFLEAAEVLFGNAEGGFDWSDPNHWRFHLAIPGSTNPVEEVLAFLGRARVHAVAPAGSAHRTEGWKIPTDVLGDGSTFPFPNPESPATLPATLVAGDQQITIDHWGEATSRTGRDNMKFWAGAAGYPGAALVRDALDLVRHALTISVDAPFAMSAVQSSSLRLDWRRDYIPLDAGFSLNEHAAIHPRGYPLVEVLAAIGLTHARPKRVNKLAYRYQVIGRCRADQPDSSLFLPPQFVRAALGVAPTPFPSRVFAMSLGWPGQENQARCITSVVEETTP